LVKGKNSLTDESGSGGGSNTLASKANSGQGGGGGVFFEPLDRSVIYYKLTSSDVILLGGLGVLATLFFSAASACFSFYVNLHITLAFATQPLPAEAQLYRDTFQPFSWYGGIIFFVIAVIFSGGSIWRFNAIKKEHSPVGASSGKI
jgi:hypothetical protein